MSEQLFETESLERAETPRSSNGPLGRHLRSVDTTSELQSRSTQWKLDDDTIRAGREGIQRARDALRESRRTTASEPQPRRIAA